MVKSEKTVILHNDKESIWTKLTDNRHYEWRSDLSKIEILDEQVFIEYTKGGFATKFKITNKTPFQRYEFDLENKNMTGHFTALLEEKEEGIQLTLLEEVTVKNPIMRLMAKAYLQKQQNQYIADFRKEL